MKVELTEPNNKMKKLLDNFPGISDWFLDVDMNSKSKTYKYKVIIWLTNKELYEAANLAIKLTEEVTVEDKIKKTLRPIKTYFKYYE